MKQILSIVLVFSALSFNAQYYNGSNINFGQNRVQYNTFLWQSFDFERFKPLLVSIEFNNYDSDKLLESDINILMKNNDYKLISKFGVTCFYVENNSVSNIHEMMKI